MEIGNSFKEFKENFDNARREKGLKAALEDMIALMKETLLGSESTIEARGRVALYVEMLLKDGPDEIAGVEDVMVFMNAAKQAEAIVDEATKHIEEIPEDIIKESDLKVTIGLGFEKLEMVLSDDSCPPEEKIRCLNEIIKLLVATVDAETQMDNPTLDEEFCDYLMNKCAEYRKMVMKMQDEVNKEEYLFDTLFLHGYGSSNSTFGSMR